jgi:hypothetical protein
LAQRFRAFLFCVCRHVRSNSRQQMVVMVVVILDDMARHQVNAAL